MTAIQKQSTHPDIPETNPIWIAWLQIAAAPFARVLNCHIPCLSPFSEMCYINHLESTGKVRLVQPRIGYLSQKTQEELSNSTDGLVFYYSRCCV